MTHHREEEKCFKTVRSKRSILSPSSKSVMSEGKISLNFANNQEEEKILLKKTLYFMLNLINL